MLILGALYFPIAISFMIVADGPSTGFPIIDDLRDFGFIIATFPLLYLAFPVFKILEDLPSVITALKALVLLPL